MTRQVGVLNVRCKKHRCSWSKPCVWSSGVFFFSADQYTRHRETTDLLEWGAEGYFGKRRKLPLRLMVVSRAYEQLESCRNPGYWGIHSAAILVRISIVNWTIGFASRVEDNRSWETKYWLLLLNNAYNVRESFFVWTCLQVDLWSHSCRQPYTTLCRISPC